MLYSFYSCIASISVSIIFIDCVYYYLTRYDRRKKWETQFIEDVFEPFDILFYVEPPIDAFDETELQGINN